MKYLNPIDIESINSIKRTQSCNSRYSTDTSVSKILDKYVLTEQLNLKYLVKKQPVLYVNGNLLKRTLTLSN
jgi:hypothetical protein